MDIHKHLTEKKCNCYKVIFVVHFIFTSKLQRLSKLQPVLDSGETILEDRQTALTHFY